MQEEQQATLTKTEAIIAKIPMMWAMRMAMSLPKLVNGTYFSYDYEPGLIWEFRKDGGDDCDGTLYPRRLDMDFRSKEGGRDVDMLTPSGMRVQDDFIPTKAAAKTWHFADMKFLGFAYHIHDLCGEYINTCVAVDDDHFVTALYKAQDEDYDYVRVSTLCPGSRFPAELNLRDTLTPEILEDILPQGDD